MWNETGLAVLFVSDINERCYLEPVYWIKKMNTLTYETACGSGSTALGLLTAFLQKKSIAMPIIQPSLKIIKVNIKMKDKKFSKAEISGPVQKLKQGIITI